MSIQIQQYYHHKEGMLPTPKHSPENWVQVKDLQAFLKAQKKEPKIIQKSKASAKIHK